MESDAFSSGDEALLFDGGKRCTLFVVDFGEQMTNDYIRTALQLIRKSVNYLCCTGGLNELAAILYVNTSNTNKDAENIDCVYMHRKIGNMDMDYVRELDELLQSENVRSTLSDQLGEPGTCNWSEVLFLCQRLLTYSGSVLRRKAIYIFTANYEPTTGDENVLRRVKAYATDLRTKNTQLNVVLVDRNEEEEDSFDEDPDAYAQQISSFWTELDPNVTAGSASANFNNEIMRKETLFRSTTTIPLKLGAGLQLAVGVYTLIREQSKPVSIPLDLETNAVLECRTHYVAAKPTDSDQKSNESFAESGAAGASVEEEERFEGEIGFAARIGDTDVVLDRREFEGLRRFDSPGITIIGFKPLSSLKASHRMGPSKYIFPSDSDVKGSSTLCRALYQRCLERELLVLVRYTEKSNTFPQLAALLPQERNAEQKSNDSYHYEGFHLIELPYAEDKRDLSDRMTPPNNEAEWPPVDESKVETAKAFVKRLTAKYAPHQFSNPTLQRHYRGVEAIALGLDDFDEEAAKKLDKIRPYYENDALRKRVEPHIEALKREFLSTNNNNGEKTSRKRGRVAAGPSKEADDVNAADGVGKKPKGRPKKKTV